MLLNIREREKENWNNVLLSTEDLEGQVEKLTFYLLSNQKPRNILS